MLQIIVNEALQTHVLTHRQQEWLNTWLLQSTCSPDDLAALDRLTDALYEGSVVFRSAEDEPYLEVDSALSA
ncbi:MAG: hypothetical protein NW237_01885 [Cyanobacteriota bacterium]|nr:hypothetical protein [Cyanobacteriota bacterium]